MLYKYTTIISLLLFVIKYVQSDNKTFASKIISVEEHTIKSQIVLKGLILESAQLETPLEHQNIKVLFNSITGVYKGGSLLTNWSANFISNNELGFNRQLNITLSSKTSLSTQYLGKISGDYLLFCNILSKIIGRKINVKAVAAFSWTEALDDRVWAALGWGPWSDWTSCSETCGTGIQQRLRNCQVKKCQGYNVEQRQCNLFICSVNLVNPLTQTGFFHPKFENWSRSLERPSAWRLRNDSYIWMSAIQLFHNNSCIPCLLKNFSIFTTLRIQNMTQYGTLLRIRSKSDENVYLSLEISNYDLKFVFATPNGTDSVHLLNASFNNGNWHQLSIGFQDNRIIQTYYNCKWQNEIILSNFIKIPENPDITIGYLFEGDLEQLLILPETEKRITHTNLQCLRRLVTIEDKEIHFKR